MQLKKKKKETLPYMVKNKFLKKNVKKKIIIRERRGGMVGRGAWNRDQAAYLHERPPSSRSRHFMTLFMQLRALFAGPGPSRTWSANEKWHPVPSSAASRVPTPAWRHFVSAVRGALVISGQLSPSLDARMHAWPVVQFALQCFASLLIALLSFAAQGPAAPGAPGEEGRLQAESPVSVHASGQIPIRVEQS
jgi:hypothetical protein